MHLNWVLVASNKLSRI